MTTFGFLSLLPPLLAIFLSIRTKQVISSLLSGLLLGYLIIADWNLYSGFIITLDRIASVFSSDGNTKTILFTLTIGALIQLVNKSGGVSGFVVKLKTFLENRKKPESSLQIAAAVTGFLIFIESNISILTVGTVFQSLFDKFGISRQKLAYIADSSSAPSCILMPINAWGAYIIGLLAVYENLPPFETLLLSIPYNIYPILTLLLVLYLAKTNKSYGPMKQFENHEVTAQVNNPTNELSGKARNMILPIVVMILTMPIYLLYTGWDFQSNEIFIDKIWNAISEASGSSAVFYASVTALIFAGIFYKLQRIITLNTFIEESVVGMKDMFTMALLMLLAFALGSLCKELGTGLYVASITQSWLSPALAPALIFIISCFIAFSTGTSWGTFAIMISIAVPLAQSIEMNIPLAVAAVLGGGVFGDHCSPISDTTLIASMASGSDHIDHVKTQLPYALFTGGLTVIAYLFLGFLFG